LMKMVGDIFHHTNVSRDTFSKISNNKIVADLISKTWCFIQSNQILNSNSHKQFLLY
jgi:hypothetical protein